MNTFYESYISNVSATLYWKRRPALLKKERDERMTLLNILCQEISDQIEYLGGYPAFFEELMTTIEEAGHLESFKLKRMLQTLKKMEDSETQIISQVNSLSVTPLLTENWKEDVRQRAICWRKTISNENRLDFEEFMQDLSDEVQLKISEAGREARLGRALAQSEEERKRLMDIEEKRRLGSKEAELDRIEKRKRAMAAYNNQLTKRKRK